MPAAKSLHTSKCGKSPLSPSVLLSTGSFVHFCHRLKQDRSNRKSIRREMKCILKFGCLPSCLTRNSCKTSGMLKHALHRGATSCHIRKAACGRGGLTSQLRVRCVGFWRGEQAVHKISHHKLCHKATGWLNSLKYLDWSAQASPNLATLLFSPPKAQALWAVAKSMVPGTISKRSQCQQRGGFHMLQCFRGVAKVKRSVALLHQRLCTQSSRPGAHAVCQGSTLLHEKLHRRARSPKPGLAQLAPARHRSARREESTDVHALWPTPMLCWHQVVVMSIIVPAGSRIGPCKWPVDLLLFNWIYPEPSQLQQPCVHRLRRDEPLRPGYMVPDHTAPCSRLIDLSELPGSPSACMPWSLVPPNARRKPQDS